MKNVNNGTLGRPRDFDNNGELRNGETRAAQGVVILSFSHRAVSARDTPQQIRQHIKLRQHLVREGTQPPKHSNVSRTRALRLDVDGFEYLLNSVLSVAVLSV